MTLLKWLCDKMSVYYERRSSSLLIKILTAILFSYTDGPIRVISYLISDYPLATSKLKSAVSCFFSINRYVTDRVQTCQV